MPSQGTIPAAESQSQSQLVHETPMLDMCFDESQAQIAVINNQFDGLGGSMHGGDFFRQDDESLIIESDQELDARSEYSQSARSSPRRDPPGNSADLILEDDEMLEDKDEDFLHHLSPPGDTDHIAPDASPYDMASPLENDTSFREDHDEDDMLHDDADTGFGVSASRSFRLTLDDELESRLSSRDYSQNPETPPASLQIRYPESQHPQQGRFDSPSLRMEAFAIHDPCHLPYGTSPRKPQSIEHDSAPYPYHEMPQHLEMEIDDFELELGESDGLVMSLS